MDEPVMTPEDWEWYWGERSSMPADPEHAERVRAAHRLAIAMSNSELAEDDPYKLTWARVDRLREVATTLFLNGLQWDAAALRKIADAIAAYLPPRS
jgi:hypothetical protein